MSKEEEDIEQQIANLEKEAEHTKDGNSENSKEEDTKSKDTAKEVDDYWE